MLPLGAAGVAISNVDGHLGPLFVEITCRLRGIYFVLSSEKAVACVDAAYVGRCRNIRCDTVLSIVLECAPELLIR